MKRSVATIAFLLSAILLSAQENRPKTGWTFTPMPDISYNSDMGFKLGAFGDFYYYGDGSVYPNFLHHIGFAGGWATKGSWHIHTMFDTPALIPGIRLTGSITYRDAMANNFYGFNGIASPFFPELELNRKTRTAWYTNRRRIFRGAFSLLGNISGNLNWMAGGVFRKVWIDDFELDNYDSGKSLYNYYRELGLIDPEEAWGGTSMEIKAGFVRDSRDVEMFPEHGSYAELYVLGNADLQYWKYNYLQLVAHWSHYITVFKDRLIFAYHFGVQHSFGNVPFCNLNELATITYKYEEYSGLGSRYSIRGYRYNRIAAEGYAWANFEFRVVPFIFNLFNQHFEIVFNPFVDLGAITKYHRLEMQKAMPADVYQDLSCPVMASAGCGAKLHMNTNFLLSIDFGKGFNSQLNDFMIGVGGTYIF